MKNKNQLGFAALEETKECNLRVFRVINKFFGYIAYGSDGTRNCMKGLVSKCNVILYVIRNYGVTILRYYSNTKLLMRCYLITLLHYNYYYYTILYYNTNSIYSIGNSNLNKKEVNIYV